MQHSNQLSNGQINALLESDQADLASHKLRGRAGIPAAVPSSPPIPFIATYELISVAIWALKKYWDHGLDWAKIGEWGECFKVPGKALGAECHIFRKGCSMLVYSLATTLMSLSKQIEGKEIADLKSQIRALRSSVVT